MTIKSGFLLLYKPKGISSAAAIGPIKRMLPKKTKIGHAGTLDPFACGLLIVGIGSSATKELARFMTLDKTYIATGKLGEATDTLDHTGSIINRSDAIITKEQLGKVLASFGSHYIQVPPLYSALKYQGMPLYTLARNKLLDSHDLQIVAEQKSKLVMLHRLELLSFEFPYFTIKTTVSHGTYIRSLIADIGTRLGGYATTYELDRSAIGPFESMNSVAYDRLLTLKDCESQLFQLLCNAHKIEHCCDCLSMR